MNHSCSRGFIGLISLLIVSALMAFFYWRTDLLSGATGSKSSLMEQNLNAIQAAKDVKKAMEQRTVEEMQQLAN